MEVVQNIFCVKLPLPFRIDHVNCYLVKGSNGWSVIDTGFYYPPSIQEWEKAFSYYGIGVGDIENIYVTHMHPAHLGAAKWMQQLTGAPVLMGSTEIENVDKVWKKGRINLPVLGEFFKENGVPNKIIPELLDNISNVVNAVCPCPVMSPLPEGHRINIGDRLFQVINVPGHSEGHINLYNIEEGILISGDHLLSPADSRISIWPTSNRNPMKYFFQSLEVVEKLAVKKVLPAHGEVFSDCRGRVKELFDYYQRRLSRIIKLSQDSINAYQLYEHLFVNRDLKTMHYNITETLALLAFLEAESKVSSTLINGVITYKCVHEK